MNRAFITTEHAGVVVPCLAHSPEPPRRGTVICVQPFLEEANRTRRLFNVVGEALAARGWSCLLPDLPGCGESPTDLAQARWHPWVETLAALIAQTEPPVRLFSIRLGALIAAHAVVRAPVERHFALGPIDRGDTHLRHWLRVRALASKEVGPEVRVTDMEADIAAGRSLLLAGAEVSAALATDIAAAQWPGTDYQGAVVYRLGSGPGAVEAPVYWQLAEPPEPGDVAAHLADLVLA